MAPGLTGWRRGLFLYSDPVPLLPTPWLLAQALDCHVCAYNGENCFNPMRCPATVTYCMTTRTCESMGCPQQPLLRSMWGHSSLPIGGQEGGSHLPPGVFLVEGTLLEGMWGLGQPLVQPLSGSWPPCRLHPDQDEGEQVMCAQLLRDGV